MGRRRGKLCFELPDGYDIRDAIADKEGPAERVAALQEILSKLAPIPEEWTKGVKIKVKEVEKIEVIHCNRLEVVTTAWKKAMQWIDGLEAALVCQFAAVLSTESIGDQLWFKIVGPPSCGKTILAEAISLARQYILPKDTITGLFSGYQTDADGSEDLSLAPKLRNKTLVIKDADTILQLPNRAQILSQFRALYDRAVRTQYKNKMSRDHEGLNTTVVFNGTESLRQLDSSELGERMLDVVIVDKMTEELEGTIALRKAYQAMREVRLISNGKADSRDSPEMLHAKQLTGGYVMYLRDNANNLLNEVQDMGPDELQKCCNYATFVAYMRARPSKCQEETVQRELCPRLVSQHIRLAMCLAVVLNKRQVDAAVMRRVQKVALIPLAVVLLK
jgi:hypothetical protein